MWDSLPREEKLLRDFTKEFSDIKVTDPLGLLQESTETLVKARRFIRENPELASKLIHKVNSNPRVVAQLNEPTYRYVKERFPLMNTEYYVAPIAITDPMDPVAVLPAALAVAVVACALMFVGRGGLRGVV